MNIQILRLLDRLISPVLLIMLAPLGKLISALLPVGAHSKRCVFLKLKGGGSLIIALPALLALRRAKPDLRFVLICTRDAQIYADLTGIFDEYIIVEDKNLLTVVYSGLSALKNCFQSEICIDLEPNSLLAAVFCMLTLSHRRMGLVPPERLYRANAYTDAIAFDVMAPIYQHYDQLAALLQAKIPPINECRLSLEMNLPAMAAERSIRTVGIAPYTSDFAPERMMPEDVWIEVLRQEIAHDEPCRVYLFGSLKTKGQADHFIDTASRYFIRADFINLSGVCSLAEAAGTLKSLDQFWSVDSGLLHIARLLRVPCRSFWGPTNPLQRLRLIDGLNEKVFYKNFSCSPCVHLSSPPCAGNNLCMKTMAEDNPDRNPEWPTK